jgi:hypothetical protein
MAQLVKCLPSKPKALSLKTKKEKKEKRTFLQLSLVAHASNPAT